MEIDQLKTSKQDKTLCEQIESVARRDRQEIKEGFKEGVKEFKILHKKIDRIMWKLQLPPRDGEDREDGEG